MAEDDVIAKHVPFHDIANLFEKISKTQGKEKKKEIFKKFVTHWRSVHHKMHVDNKTTDSFYPAMRFFLPHLDKDRLSYGMKEVVLARYYIDVLNISKESADGKRLLNYRAPGSAKQDAGDFASVAYVVLENRCPEKGNLTVEEVNMSLDEMAQANAEKRRDIMKKEIQKLIRNTSALEQKWVIRILLKEMKLGLNENSIFPVFHPESQELYNVCNSLSKVCLDLHDINTKLNETEITLFTPFRPMLGQRATINEVEKLMRNEQFVMETKIDGERIQLHKDGDEFRYFSRSSIDYTRSFGATKYRGTLTPFIANIFKHNINSCILDGEMVGYDTELNDFVLKGSNIDIKSTTLETIQPCFVVFDVLMINGKKLANVPLKERIQRAEHVFDTCDGRLQHVTRRLAKTNNEVIQAINDAIDKREEGIVVKDLTSLYKPSKRKGSGWLKLKPEYVDSLSDKLDLVIIGGEYGSGRRGGMISHFLLGVAVTPEQIGENPTTFMTFGKVGSGYSDKELKHLCDKLHKHWRKFDVKQPPASILFTQGFKEKPDVWIEPKHSIIAQIKAAEITVSDKYKCGCTMRFPRLEKIREDKNWYECMTNEEVQELRKIADGKLTYKLTDGTLSNEPSKKKRRLAPRIERTRTVADHFKGADVTDVKETSQLFAGKEFYIINGPVSFPKRELEKKVTEFGGTFVQNPGTDTMCVVADKINFRVKNIISGGNIDVVNSTWLIESIEKKLVIPYKPNHMLHSTAKTLASFRIDFDRYGDSYVEDTNKEKLVDIFSTILEFDDKINQNDIAEIEHRYFTNDSKLGLFRRCRMFIDGQAEKEDEFLVLEYKFHGGIVTEEFVESSTHVLVSLSNATRLQSLRQQISTRPLKPHIVTSNWIADCIGSKTILNERPYEPA